MLSSCGWTLFEIPFEEIFFFFIQTYITSTLYALVTKPVVHAVHLRATATAKSRLVQCIGGFTLTTIILSSYQVVTQQVTSKATYLALIFLWSAPFLLLLWTLSYSHIIALPYYATLLPIILPTLYLWLVDTLALRRGTWVINTGTKLELQLWQGLEIEFVFRFSMPPVIMLISLKNKGKLFSFSSPIC
jgi:15-cis-phytoene synthase/lycopene beta-cyclase